jgi:hypothetical protein
VYLRGFAQHRGKPKLFVVDTRRAQRFTTSTINIAVEVDFHRGDARSANRLLRDALRHFTPLD